MASSPKSPSVALVRGALFALAVSACALLGAPAVAQGIQGGPVAGQSNSFQVGFDGAIMAMGGQPILVDRLAIAGIGRGQRHVFRGFPLSMFESVDLEVERIVAPGENVPAEVMRGGAARRVTAAPLDAFVGSVVGAEDSRVILTLGEAGFFGSIEMGDRKFMITSGDPRNPHGPAVFDMDSPQFQAMPVKPFACNALRAPGGAGGGAPGGTGGMPGTAAAPATCIQVELALDSDNAFLELFPDTSAALAYMQTLVIYSSQIYQEDLQSGFDISFWRIWEDQDPWSAASTAQQLFQFRDYWKANETDVHRDLAHLVSGLGLGGGVAFLEALCTGDFGYGVSADLAGFFPTPLQDRNGSNWDIIVFSHEIGHNFGAEHTHDLIPAPDCCFASADPAVGDCPEQDCTNANRGTIMSYCHLCAGGVGNITLSFAPGNKTQMAAYLDTRSCLSTGDCPTDSCVLAVTPSQFSIGKDGGCFSVNVLPDPVASPADAGCPWTISGLPAWIVRADADCNALPPSADPAGNEAGAVFFKVNKNTPGIERSGTFTVGGQSVSVRQLGGTNCGIVLAANALSARATAGSVVLPKLLTAGCSWTVSSSAAWLSANPTSGAGSATARDVTVTFLANTGAAQRSGKLTFLAEGEAQGIELTVTQVPAAPCVYTLSTAALNVSPEAGTHAVTVTSTVVDCTWTASTDSSWLSVGPTSGSGTRQLFIGVRENRTSVARSGKVYVGGGVITVTQAAGPDCSLGAVTLSSSSITTESPGGSKVIAVEPAASWCSWTASSNRSWLSASPASGTGDGDVTITWQPNTSSSSRSGTVTIGNKTYSVTQLGVSGSALLSSWKAVGGISAAGNSSRTMVVPLEAKSLLRVAYNVNFRTVGTSHLSEFILRVEIPGSTSKFISVRPSTATNSGECVCTGSSTTNLFAGAPFDIPAGVRELKVFCYETADDGGPSQLDAFMASGTITLTFGTTTGCSYSLSEGEVNVPAAAGTGTVVVNSSSSTCVWSASSNRSWLTVDAGGSGTRTITYRFERNSSTAARTGTITVAGQTLTVTQPGTVPWTPSMLETPKVWMRADEIPAADRAGGLVSRWADLGPGGNALTATGVARPRWVSGAINGKAVVQFDGVDDILSRGTVSMPSGGSSGAAMFVVRKATTATPAGSRQFAHLSTGSDAAQARLALSTGVNGKAVAQGRRPDSGALVSVTSASAVTATSVQLQAAVLDPVSGKLTEFVNGASVGQASLGSSSVSSSVSAPKALRLGGSGVTGQLRYSGAIGEFLLVPGPVTECQRRMIEGYLAHRWGIAASLPASHPYRAAPPDTSNACE